MNKRYYEHTLSTTREFIEYLLLMEQDEIYYFTAQKRIKDAYERFNGGR